MKSSRKEPASGPVQPPGTVPEKYERFRKERERVFNAYINNLGLDLKTDLSRGADVLDVGSGRLGAFGDACQAERLGCRVVSLDRGEFVPVEPMYKTKLHKKIGDADYETVDLKERLGTPKEPQFDLIVSHCATPTALAEKGEAMHTGGVKAGQPDLHLMSEKLQTVMNKTIDHLKPGGKAVFFPVFDAEMVRMPDGRDVDYRYWRTMLNQTLEEIILMQPEKKITVQFEPVRKEGWHMMYRLIVKRHQ